VTENGARDDRESTTPEPVRLGIGRELTAGSGDPLTSAFELVLTPALFGFIGWRLDRIFGSGPVLLILFFVLVLVYEVWKLTKRYSLEMDAEERKLLGRGDS
jgi:F0F1-type ATP synthase assembly protein I